MTYLSPLMQAPVAMASGSIFELAHKITDVTRNLATTPPAQLAKALTIFSQALRPEKQFEALVAKMETQGARLGQSVSMALSQDEYLAMAGLQEELNETEVQDAIIWQLWQGERGGQEDIKQTQKMLELIVGGRGTYGDIKDGQFVEHEFIKQERALIESTLSSQPAVRINSLVQLRQLYAQHRDEGGRVGQRWAREAFSDLARRSLLRGIEGLYGLLGEETPTISAAITHMGDAAYDDDLTVLLRWLEMLSGSHVAMEGGNSWLSIAFPEASGGGLSGVDWTRENERVNDKAHINEYAEHRSVEEIAKNALHDLRKKKWPEVQVELHSSDDLSVRLHIFYSPDGASIVSVRAFRDEEGFAYLHLGELVWDKGRFVRVWEERWDVPLETLDK